MTSAKETSRPKGLAQLQWAQLPWTWIGLGFGALLLRLTLLWEIRDQPLAGVLLGDAWSYDRWAQRLAAGDWWGSEVFYQAPFYPYFMGVIYALAGHSVWAVRLVQAVLGATSCLLLALAGRGFFSRRVGLIAGWMLAVYPAAIFFDAIVQKTSVGNFLFCATLLIVAKLHRRPSWPLALLCGLTLACLVLTRENALVFVAAIGAWLLVRSGRYGLGRRFSLGGALAAGLLLVLLPVAARNHTLDGGFHLTTSQFGPNFYIGNHAGADGRYVPLRPDRGHAAHERNDATELAQEQSGRALSPGEVSQFWTQRAMDFIRRQPGAWLALLGRKCLLLVNAVEIGDTEDLYTYAQSSRLLAGTLLLWNWGILLPLAAAGICLTAGHFRRIWILHLLLISYAASVVLFYVFARYRYPLVPLLMLFAAAGVYRVVMIARRQTASPEKKRSKRDGCRLRTGRSRAFWAVPVVAVLTATLAAHLPLLSREHMQVATYYTLATELLRQGDAERAIAYFRKALAIAPDHGAAHLRLAATLAERGDHDGALGHYQEAVRWRPSRAEAHHGLAVELLRKGELKSAWNHFGQAVELDAEMAPAHCGLGNVLVSARQPQQAEPHFRRALVIEPNLVEAHTGLGVALMSQGKHAEAQEHFARWVELAPASAEARINLGSALINQRQTAAAERQFRQALEIRPDSPLALNNLAVALARQGKRAEAIEHLQRAVQIAPDYQAAQRFLRSLTRDGKP